MWFTRAADGSITVDDWDREPLISADFLTAADDEHVRYIDGEITIIVSNGVARYKVLEWNLDTQACRAMLVEAEIDIAA